MHIILGTNKGGLALFSYATAKVRNLSYGQHLNLLIFQLRSKRRLKAMGILPQCLQLTTTTVTSFTHLALMQE